MGEKESGNYGYILEQLYEAHAKVRFFAEMLNI